MPSAPTRRPRCWRPLGSPSVHPIPRAAAVWSLFLVATLACFIGRTHIYLGSAITNCIRTETSDPPRISQEYAFVMWFSGLRGGVAFALASVSFTSNDFATRCGGLPAGSECPFADEMNDSTASKPARARA